MNVKSAEKKEKNLMELAVEVSAEEFENAINVVYRKNKNMISVPGFRKGKAPRKIIESMYGPTVFYEDAVESLLPQALEFAVEQEKLDIVGRPSILDIDISDEKLVTIKYEISLYPEVTLGEYKGISAPKATVKVLKKEIDEELENVRKRNARIETVERAAKQGDTANIDFEGFLNNVPFEGGKGEGYNLVLGSNSFVPGFEEQVIGMSAGDEKEIPITFPKDYTADLAGKDVVFKVKVNEVKENILPELDDEFAKDVSEFDTLDEYKASIKEKITEQKKASAEKAFQDAVMDKVIDNMDCDIPEGMLDERIESTLQNYERSVAAQGMNFESYLNIMGTTPEKFREELRPGIERQIKIDLALEKISGIEDIEVTEEDIENEYTRLAEKYSMKLEDAKKSINLEVIKNQLKFNKVQELIYSTALVEKKAKKKAADESGEAAAEPEKAE